jgi:hypothetical protein
METHDLMGGKLHVYKRERTDVSRRRRKVSRTRRKSPKTGISNSGERRGLDSSPRDQPSNTRSMRLWENTRP